MSDQSEPKLGINSWLQEELYQNYLHDKKNVDDTWKRVFEANGHPKPSGANGHGAAAAPAPVVTPAVTPSDGKPPVSPAAASADHLVPLRGVAAKIAENMTVSLTVPTATSQRMIPVRVIEEKRQQINERRAAAGQGKISYTHLISWAIVRALDEFPSLNHSFAEQNGELLRVVHKDVNIGIAVDVKAKDGSSSLMVPNIKNAGAMNFSQFLGAFDDIVSRARTGKLQMPDFQGTTISLTNPGTVGTLASVPRLVAGQGAIIATGAMDYPAEYQTVTAEMKAHIGISKVMMITCTYDHRIIQGAESGRFLGKLQALLNGEGGFYDKIYSDLGISQTLAALIPAAVAPVLPAAASPLSTGDALKEAASAFLINAYRVRGHLIADLDPLGSTRPMQPDLELSTYGLTEADLDRPLLSQSGRTLRTVIADLRKTYCDKVACEYMFIQYPDQKEWLRQRMESTLNSEPLDRAVRLRILDRLIEGEEFEHFLDKRYIGKKRFSVEGGESALVMLDETLERAVNGGAEEAVIGMAHRGRLTVLANICNKPLVEVFSDFDEAPGATANRYSTGDVKYHLGAHGIRTSTEGKSIGVSMAFNPSHLEAVDPVVEGMVRAKQDELGDGPRKGVIPILIHGDAAFAGQGVVFETLNLSQLPGYFTGGTVHLIINNQVGFTTAPEDGRSGPYASDVARSIQAPIFHVNGDDPEAVLRVSRIAFDFRQKFSRDVVIDLICYRRLGHNEGDDPSITQPLMYKKIKAQPSVIAKYADRLVNEGVVDKAGVDARKAAYVARLSEAFDISKSTAATEGLQFEPEAPVQFLDRTTIDRATAEQVVNAITAIPADFHLHPKLKPVMEKRKAVLADEPFDWATGEALAFGSLLTEGYSVRLSGQDVGRGTFGNRHMELTDFEDGHEYVPLKALASPGQLCEVWGSSLSEYAAMGFEFGFSLASPSTLVMWEGQFGDFVNGAQIVVDQFLSSSEKKWGELCGLVLLLPHGYEGLGPEHSSARIERFLQLCAQGNMQVANVTTPAQYFHILRRQLRGGADGKPIRKPLIIFTPKSLLRSPAAVSRLEELTSGKFEEVLGDTGGAPVEGVKRVLMCSGKIYYDLQERRTHTNANHVAILRVEQMYPFPKDELQSALQEYPAANEFYWVQEEPKNMGPWRFMQENIQPMLDGIKRTLRHITRPESASPAVGTNERHKYEQNEVVDDAFAEKLVARTPKRPKLIKKKKLVTP